MATFAPQLPQQSDPEYLRYSRAIPQPEGDKSGTYIGKIGEDIHQGLDTTDKVVAHYAEQQAFEQGDEARKREEERLDPIYQQVVLGQSPNANSELKASQFTGDTDPSGSVIQKNEDLPAEIRYGTRNVSSLAERFNNGKLSQTDYKSEVDKIAKDLNAQFPAWRKEITQGLSRATGVAGADATIQSKVQDINRVLTQLNEQKNKIITKILGATDKMDPEAISRLYSDFTSGRITESQALQAISNAEYPDTVVSRAKNRIQLNQELRKESQYKSGNEVDDVLGGISLKHMNNILVKNGVSTPSELIEKLQAGRGNPDDPLMLQLSGQLRNAVDLEEKEMRAALAPHRAALGGQAEVEKKIAEHMAYHKAIVADLADPSKAGNAVTAALQDTQATERQLGNYISKDPTGRKLMLLKKMQELTPDLAGKMNTDALANDKDFGANIGHMLSNFQKSALAVDPKDLNNRPSNANADIEALQRAGANPKALQGHINFVSMLAERSLPDDQAYNLAKYYFRPENQGMVGKFSRDAFNPATGKTSEGQVNVFRTLGSKDVSDRIYELGKSHPDIIRDYRNFMENTFAHEVFPTLLMDMRDVSLAAGDRLAYDSDKMNFHLDTKDIVGNSRVTSSPFIRSTVNRLNYSLDSMREIAKHENKDPNAYLIQLIRAGNPDAFSSEVKGFPSDINNAIKNQMLVKEMEKRKQEEGKSKAIERSQ